MMNEMMQMGGCPTMIDSSSKFKVFRKAAPNDKLQLFMFSRDYFDDATAPPVINGVIKVDPNYVSERNVYVQMVLIFGRKGDPKNEGTMDHSFSTKKLYLDCQKIYPLTCDPQPNQQQQDLITKLGSFAYPFRLAFPILGAPSYQMMQGSKDEQSNLGLEYEVMAFVGKHEWDEHKRSTARVAVWRIQTCPPALLSKDLPKPKGHRTKSFLMYNGSMHVDVVLNKNIYTTDEEMTVHVEVMNTCQREITNIKVKLVQRNQIPMFVDDGVHDMTIQKVEDKVHITQGQTLTREYMLITRTPPRKKYGQIMLEGTIGRDGVEVLASSSHMGYGIQKRDIFGIFVEYVVKVKVTFGHIPGETVCEVPFVLTHQKFSKKND